jgi:two-component system sensor histidine kinase/response regulator
MTAKALEGDRELCLAAGMDNYMAKPITTAAIDEVLSRWLPGQVEGLTYTLQPERISELRSTFPGHEFREMVVHLRREVDSQLDRVSSALAEHDGAEAAGAAHDSVERPMIGASGLIEAASELEACCRSNMEEARVAGGRVREEWERAYAALEAGAALR